VRLGNNRRVKTRAMILIITNKNDYTSAVPPRSSSFPSLSVIIISLLSSYDVITCINSAEKLEYLFEAITHVAGEDIFSCSFKTLNNQKPFIRV